MRRLIAMAVKGFDEALFTEFFEVVVDGFGDTVGVEGEKVA